MHNFVYKASSMHYVMFCYVRLFVCLFVCLLVCIYFRNNDIETCANNICLKITAYRIHKS